MFITFFILPAQIQAQTDYALWISGYAVTDQNCKDLSKIKGVTGKVSYDPDTKTLTMEDARIDGGNLFAIKSEVENLIVKVIGTNNITNKEFTAVTFSKRAAITGGGTLNIEGDFDCAIFVDKTYLVIDHCTVNAKGNECGISGDDGKSGEKLGISNATVTAEGKGKGSICNFDKMPLKSCALVAPRKARFNADAHGVTVKGKITTEKITIKPVDYYGLIIGGLAIHTDNCNDLSTLEEVDGTAKYDDNTKTLTLDNATIKVTEEDRYGLFSFIDGLTINLIGNSTITSEKAWGLFNYESCALTITGNGKLTINGAAVPNAVDPNAGIVNRGIITVSGCTLEANGGIYGLGNGMWKFDRCNVFAKGGPCDDMYSGTISWLTRKPEFVECKIIVPADAYWEKFESANKSYYSLFGADKKVVTGLVAIQAITAGIDAPTSTDAATTPRSIYSLSGVRLSGELKDLPKGIYIVNGKKVVKQ